MLMKATGGVLVRHALEQIGVKYTFGIPGVHTVEIYDELNKSELIEPILVAHEGGGAFMADAIGRTTDSIGTLVTVPAAGTTHAASGIAEAYLDGVPMLVISGGIRRDTGRYYQLHQIDQETITRGFVKSFFLVEKHEDIIPVIYKAYDIATSGEPGPVFVEVASNLLITQGELPELPAYQSKKSITKVDEALVRQVVELVRQSKRPVIYAGWGARDAGAELMELAELLQAPVATTMQGLSVFPSAHELHVGMGFGRSAVPAAENAFHGHDCMIAVGVRFAELATGSYGVTVSENLVHIDINPDVFNKNFPARLTIASDATMALRQLLAALKASGVKVSRNVDLVGQIRKDKEDYEKSWTSTLSDKLVSPGIFFKKLNSVLEPQDYLVCDDGNHTFLTGELFKCHRPRHYICPTDFNAMGYCIPAAIATKLAHPGERVVGIVGDGALLMTGLELITATSNNLGVVIFVFHDGELGQISQFQKVPLNRKTCTVLNDIRIEGIALATGAKYLEIKNDHEVNEVIDQAFALSKENMPVLVDVRIDYSRKTRFTSGVVKTNLSRFPAGEKVRFIGRALKRHLLG